MDRHQSPIGIAPLVKKTRAGHRDGNQKSAEHDQAGQDFD
jgi:hypothetical protein